MRLADLDGPLRSTWGGATPSAPVFIMGLHRSGTTFLYESLARTLPVTKVTLADVVFFPRLVHSRIDDHGAADEHALAAYLEEHGTSHRLGENLRLSADTPEEYGWILRRFGGSFKLSEKTRPVFEELQRKMGFLHPQSEAILLKNPWDTSNAGLIAEMFPQARFVFLRRNPIEILNSEVRNAVRFGSRRDPLVNLLAGDIMEVRGLLRSYRILYRLLGESLFSKALTRLMFADIKNNLRGYEEAMSRIPEAHRIEVAYADLVDRTRETLVEVAAFLGLELSAEVDVVRGRRRSGGKLPAVAAREAKLVQSLTDEGLSRFLAA